MRSSMSRSGSEVAGVELVGDTDLDRGRWMERGVMGGVSPCGGTQREWAVGTRVGPCGARGDEVHPGAEARSALSEQAMRAGQHG